ncbi:MAG TPA: inositol monophosphatase family protein [Candidatus Limnocylindrales bacterium]
MTSTVPAPSDIVPSDPLAAAGDSRYAPELELAARLAEQAGRLLVERSGRLERIDHKGPRDVVTEVDHLSEALVIEGIHDRFPDDAVLAEESGRTAARGAAAPNGRVWIVDPLDGTINYANGIPFYCVALALAVDGEPVVGVVHDPVRGETFSATADGPALLDGEPIAVVHKERLQDLVVTVAVGGSVRRRRAVVKQVRAARSMGSAALTLAYVANGRFDVYAQGAGLSSWDLAAAGLVAERAGARVTALDGSPWFDLARADRKWTVLAAAPEHHATLLGLLG